MSPVSPALVGRFFTTTPPGKPIAAYTEPRSMAYGVNPTHRTTAQGQGKRMTQGMSRRLRARGSSFQILAPQLQILCLPWANFLSSLNLSFLINKLGVRRAALLGSISSVQFISVTQLCPTLCNPMNCSTPGLPVHHQLPEFTQTHVHQVGDSIQPSYPLSSPSPLAPVPPSIRLKQTMRIRYTAQCLEHCRNSMQVRYGYYLKCKVHYNLQSIPADMEQKEEKNSAKAEDEQSEGHKRPRESQC